MKQENLPPFATVKQICKLFPFLKEGGIRHLIFVNSDFRNKCVNKIGRKILLNVPEVLLFIKNSK